jgi:NADPH-dependent ferric siderophore reductase
VEVVEKVERSPRLLRITLTGDGLRSLVVDQPAASIRLLVPAPDDDGLEMPTWDGNEFLLADGSRPLLRTFTPLRVDNERGRMDVEIVRHDGGAISGWAETAAPGDRAAVSGPGRGFDLPDGVTRLILLGDETALPAVGQLMEWVPAGVDVEAHVEVITGDAVVEMVGDHHDAVTWHVSVSDPPGSALVEVARSFADLPESTHLWAAGEASAMQAIRSHLFTELGLARSRATVRGYWKPARHSSD